ncbi:MAG: NUDIX hydrolase [Anaerolineae bacterium]
MPRPERSIWTVEDFRRALQEPLPGLGAQLRMSPRPRPTRPWPPGHSSRRAGVLLLLYPNAGEWWFPLTLRTEGLATHQGQVSLPGGAWEPEDPNLQHTALRETEEELGVPSETLQVLGKLTPLYIPPSDFCIHPFVAVADALPRLHPDPTEVAQVIQTPLRVLLDPGARQWEERPVRGVLARVPYFAIEGHKVWGATAMVLSEFAACLERLG